MRPGSSRRSVLGLVTAALLVGACGSDDESETPAEPRSARAALTSAEVPEGFSATPEVTLDGKEWTFDNVPGHFWKVLDDGYAVGLHFQTTRPFPWAKDVRPGELLYMVYAIPGHCGDGSHAKAVKAKDATVFGATPPGFDHWHGLVGGGSKTGHWLMHIPVRDFTLAGPPGNPMEGAPVKAGQPGFMPVCDLR